MQRPTLALLVVLLLLPAPLAAADHLVAGLDCAPAQTYVARIEARIVAQRAVYNTTSSQLAAAKVERDDLAEELVESGGPMDELTDAVIDALSGQGSKLATVVENTLDAIDAGTATTGVEIQDEFFLQFDLFDMTVAEGEAAIDANDKEDELADLVEAGEEATGAIGTLLDERASAARAKRTLDALGAELRALANEAGNVRQMCGLGGAKPQVPASEPTLGAPEGPSDADLLAALFASANVVRLIDDAQADYVSTVLEPLDPFLDTTPDANDMEDALDDAEDALRDLAEPIDRAIDLHLGALDALDMTLPLDAALVEDRDEETADSTERTDALGTASVAEVVMRTNTTLARSSVSTARTSAGNEVRFVAPTGAAWPGQLLVVGAGADPAFPVVTLGSNGTTRLLAGSYDLYASDASGRYLLRAGVPIASDASTVEIGGRVRVRDVDALAGARWGIVPAGSVILSSTRTATDATPTVLAPPGTYDAFVQRPGRIESFVGRITVSMGGLADVTLPEACRAPADALILDLDGNGIDLGGAVRGAFVSAPNATVRWTRAGTDDAFLVIDATSLRAAGWSLRAKGVDADGLIGLDPSLTAAGPSGDPAPVADAVSLLILLDTNKDGKVDATDASWASLRLWVDDNADGNLSVAEVSNIEDEARSLGTAFGASSADTNGTLARSGNFTREAGGTGVLRAVSLAATGRCGNPVPATPVTPTPTPTPTATTPVTTTTPPTVTSPTPVTSPEPTPTPSPTPTSPTPPSPSPTPTTVEGPQGPIPGAPIALVLALVAAIAVAWRRR